MYAGRIVEGAGRAVFGTASPYTKGLLGLFPILGRTGMKRLGACPEIPDAHGRGSADARLRFETAMFGEDGCLP